MPEHFFTQILPVKLRDFVKRTKPLVYKRISRCGCKEISDFLCFSVIFHEIPMIPGKMIRKNPALFGTYQKPSEKYLRKSIGTILTKKSGRQIRQKRPRIGIWGEGGQITGGHESLYFWTFIGGRDHMFLIRSFPFGV